MRLSLEPAGRDWLDRERAGDLRGHGLETFPVPQGKLIKSGDRIALSKDGCYAAFGKFKQMPELPQFNAARVRRSEVELHKVPFLM